MIAAHALVAPSEAWSSWLTHPLALLPVILAGAWYFIGAGRMRTWPRKRSIAFLAGLSVMALAAGSPLDALGESTFAWHMAQHLVMILGAAPLLAWGRPALPFLRALPSGPMRSVGRLRRTPLFMRAGRALRNPFAALVAHAAILWLWHFPAFYEAAIGHELLHALEHFAFVGSAFWFWTTIIPARRRSPAPVRILAVFGNLLQGGALGVLLLFASRSLYEVHAGGAAIWGLTPLEDQQLAGVLMWVPPGIVYFSVMAVLFARWLRQVETIMSARTSALETSRVSSGVSGRGADHA